MTSIAVSVKSVSKKYYSYDSKWSQLKHTLSPSAQSGVVAKTALSNINFEVSKGEAVGIIGRNGCGKSTLLQIITGTLKPTTGTATVSGMVAALLELGSGFNPEFSGRENVFLNSMLMGLTREQTEARFDEIAGFADIGDVLSQPVKTYSSGMLIRLAFSVQVALKPEVLIVDEALSVGDYFFRQKCYQRIADLRESGMTLLFVTHDMGTVSSICDRALYIQNGELLHDGNPNRAIRAYLGQESMPNFEAKISSDTIATEAPRSRPKTPNWCARENQSYERGGLLNVNLLDANNEVLSNIKIGDKVTVSIRFVPDPQREAHIYLHLKNVYNELIFTSGTYFLDVPGFNALDRNQSEVTFSLDMNVGGGEYSLQVLMGMPLPPNGVGQILSKSEFLGPISIGGDYAQERAPFLGPFGLPINAYIKDIQQ